MSSASIGLDSDLQQYLLDVSLHEPLACEQLRQQTATLPEAQMISSPEQVQLLLLMFNLLKAGKGLEVGTFTGYSSLRWTLGIPGLHMTCCDINEEFTTIAARHWKASGVDGRIDLRIAPAQETLQGLIDAGFSHSYDFAYIDADKSGYKNYVEACLALVRPGGLITLDNVLWGGSVIDSNDNSEDTQALRDLNRWLHQQAEGRYDLSLVPIGDGLTILRKY